MQPAISQTWLAKSTSGKLKFATFKETPLPLSYIAKTHKIENTFQFTWKIFGQEFTQLFFNF